MNRSADPFENLLAIVLKRNPFLAHMGRTVQKELLHHDILNIMSRRNWLDGLTFMGGTALRLCYGAPRLSEDLDFSGGPGFTADRMDGLAEDLRAGLSRLKYLDGLNVDIRNPKPASLTGFSVMTWRIVIRTGSGSRNQMVKIDVDGSLSHTGHCREIVPNYDEVRDSRSLIHVQGRQEILASKLIAFPVSVATRNRPRHRDIWDIGWITGQGVEVVPDLVRAKASIHDMKGDWMLMAADRITTIIRSPEFSAEMHRFLPLDIIENVLENPAHLNTIARRTGDVLRFAHECLDHDGSGNDPPVIPDPWVPPLQYG